MGRHRHVVTVRSDGLSKVLQPLLHNTRISAATLLDVGSGMVLDGYASSASPTDLELLGATHAELMKIAANLVCVANTPAEPVSIVLSHGGRTHHLLRTVPDLHGDRLVLSVVVHGSSWHVFWTRWQLRRLSVDTLTAGPTISRRPVDGRWIPTAAPLPDSLKSAPDSDPAAPGLPAVQDTLPPTRQALGAPMSIGIPVVPTPPAAMPPRAPIIHGEYPLS